MKKKLKIFIIAGEVSGDVLGAKIMKELPGVQFAVIGGENMQARGLCSIFPISDLAVMGLFEVLARARTLTRRINQTAGEIIKFGPDIVLTVDAPGFAKRVIKKVKQCGVWSLECGVGRCGKLSTLSEIPSVVEDCPRRPTPHSKLHTPHFYHVVAPQVWAWGESRAKKFAKIFDRLYAFFDFEVPYFTKYGLPAIPVGHPIADGLCPPSHVAESVKNIALIPGSRMSEVKRLLSVFRQFAESFAADGSAGGRYKFFIPIVETTEKYIRERTADWRVKPTLVPAAKRYELFAKTDLAIAASGTVSAELAIMHIPAVVVYKMNPLTMFFARLFVKAKWASLVNILLKKTVYPELLGGDATAENIIREVRILKSPAARKKMISRLSSADKMWTRGAPAAKLIAKDISSTF